MSSSIPEINHCGLVGTVLIITMGKWEKETKCKYTPARENESKFQIDAIFHSMSEISGTSVILHGKSFLAPKLHT